MQTVLFIHCAQKLERINAQDISLIEASGHYVKISTDKGAYLVTSSLTKLEEELPDHLFCRVHRSYIIPIPRIVKIERELIRLENREVPLAAQFKQRLFSKIKVIW
jgi:DNA-binding LytR/AlgR family response regulator